VVLRSSFGCCVNFLYSQVLVILRLITTLTLCFILLGPQPVFEILHSKHIGGHEFDLLSRGPFDCT